MEISSGSPDETKPRFRIPLILPWASLHLHIFFILIFCLYLPQIFNQPVRWVYAPRFFVSTQQRFGVTDIKAPSECHSSRLFSSCFFSSPWACPMQMGLSQECCSTWSPHPSPWTFLWPSFVLFSRASPLFFSHRHFGLLFPILTS